MKRKAIALLLAAAMGLSLCACGKTNESKASNDDDGSDVSVEDGESKESEPNGLKGEEEITGVVSAISEERLWVRYGEEESPKTCLIDTDGNLIYQVEQLSSYTDVTNGIAYVSTYIPGSMRQRDIHIIDNNGKELKTIEGTNDTFYSFLAVHNGNCLVYSFDGSKHSLKILNSNGEFIYSRDIESNSTDALLFNNDQFAKVDDGLYVIRIKNTEARTADLYLVNFSVPSIVHAVSDNHVFFRSGNIIYAVSDDYDYYQVLKMETYADDDAFAAAIKKVQEGEKYTTTGKERVIYDIKTSTRGETLNYGIKVNDQNYIILNMYTFDGYCLLEIADSYMTQGFYMLTDLSGNKIWDPKPMEKGSYFLDMDDGNLLMQDGVILKSGEKVAYDKLPSDFKFKYNHNFSISFLASNDSSQKEYRYAGSYETAFNPIGGVYDGYLIPRVEQSDDELGPKYPKSFQTLDGSKVVTKIKLG